MKEEIWKDIPNFEGIYEASTKGKIRTKEGKKTFTKRHGVRIWKSRILKPRGGNIKTGNRVFLWKDGKSYGFLTARLIAITFLGLPQNNETVNHKDGNRKNNEIDNLEWLSLAENIRHGHEMGLFPQHKTILKTNNREIIFTSNSKASRSLGRCSGYIHGRLKNGKTNAYSKEGVEYEIVFSGLFKRNVLQIEPIEYLQK